jgi:hypothetical protein
MCAIFIFRGLPMVDALRPVSGGLTFLAAGFLFLAACALAGCSVGPNCDAACENLSACVQAARCMAVCSDSAEESPWSCVEHAGARACDTFESACALPASQLTELTGKSYASSQDGDATGTGDSQGNTTGSVEGTGNTTGDPAPALSLGSVSIYSDDNGSGTVQPGETVCLSIILDNTGTADAQDVSATVATTNAYVTVLRSDALVPGGNQTYDSIGSGSTSNVYFVTNSGTCGSRFGFVVSSSAPAGTVLDFTVQVTSAGGGSWTLTFAKTVQTVAANLSLGTVSVYSDNNGSGTVQPGETVCLSIVLQNTGSEDALDVAATVATANAYVTVLRSDALLPSGNQTYDSLSSGSTSNVYFVTNSGTCGSRFGFVVSNSAPAGTVLDFTVQVTSAGGGQWTLAFAKTVQTVAANLSLGTVSVYSDNNGSGTVQPGETVCLSIALQNTGTEDALDVAASVSTSNAYVTVLRTEALVPSGNLTYDSLSSGSTGSMYYLTSVGTCGSRFGFTLSSSAPDGAVLSFTVAITSAGGGSWSRGFSVTVHKVNAVLSIASASIQSDTNASGTIQPGETVCLSLLLQNTGPEDALDVTVTLTALSGYVTALRSGALLAGGSTTYDYVNSGTTANALYTTSSGACSSRYGFTVAAGAPVGTVLNFTATLASAGGGSWTSSFSKTVQ